jgi:hypothetical protein
MISPYLSLGSVENLFKVWCASQVSTGARLKISLTSPVGGVRKQQLVP